MPEELEKEKLEFLKREEIKTMRKDIARLREIEAQKERERVATLEAEKKKKEEVKVVPPTKAPEILIPKPPKRPHPSKKVLVRVGIFLLFLLLAGFFYWFFFSLKKIEVEEVLPPPEEIIRPKKEIVERPEIPVPPPLISVERVITPMISQTKDIPEIFSQTMKEELAEGSFVQVAIKNISENRLASLKNISQAFQVEVPEGVFEKLEKSFTLSIYSQKEGKRIALIVKTKEKEALDELLKNWEEKISNEGIFVSGQKISSLASSFKTAHHQEIAFRYLTISKADLGVCYSLLDNYFIFTTSFESMQKIIEQLKGEISPALEETIEEKIGQLFIVGFEGKTITPQLEEFFKKYKPGGVLLLSKNIETKDQLKNLISGLQELSLRETGLPLFVAVDQEGEPISRIGFLEEKTSQSEITTTTEAFQIGQNRGRELKELGINLNLAPVLDDMKSGDFYFNRAFQKPPEVAGELAKSLILGQKEARVLTAIKHFPGYVDVPFNPESQLATIALPEISQFKKAMEAGPELVMVSNVVYKEIDPSLPFAFSSQGIQFLKDNLGSEILIISDDLAQNSLLKNFSLKEIVAKPIQAGVDILIFSGWRTPVEQGLDIFLGTVKNKEISETRINEAVSKITQLKQKLLQ